MDHSPDQLHHVRLAQASVKAAHIKVQLAEYHAHKRHVDEYKVDMFAHLFALDAKTRPNLSLIQQQPEINLRMRPVLLDFLMDVINKLNLSKSTFPLTVNIIDRYCLVRIVKKQHYQLLGLTALWIACKNLDSKHRVPVLADLCRYCCNCYDKKLFLEMESHVLKLFLWLVSAPTFDLFIDLCIHPLALGRLLAGSKSPHQTCNDIKVIALYVCELIQFYPNIYFNYTTPQIAVVAFALACMVVGVCLAQGVALLVHTVYRANCCEPVVADAELLHAVGLLTKVVKCPPPSMKAKYFGDDSRFLLLMKMLVGFSLKPVVPPSDAVRGCPDKGAVVGAELALSRRRGLPVHCTPKASGGVTTPKYPITPMLLTLTPMLLALTPTSGGEDYTTHNIRIYCDPQHAAYTGTLPLPNLLPGDGAGPQCSQPAKRSYDGDSYGHKRSKSSNNTFFYVH